MEKDYSWFSQGQKGPPTHRAPTLEEIVKIMEYPDRRIKAIVSTMVSSRNQARGVGLFKMGRYSSYPEWGPES